MAWRERLKRFRSDCDGSASVELCLWIVPVVGLFLLAADSTLAFMRQSQMWQVSRETARIVARYGMTETDAETYAAQKAAVGGIMPTVDVTFPAGEVVVSMSMPVRALVPFGTLNFALSDTITTNVVHAMEPM